MKRVNIKLVGWYGHGGTGYDLIAHCVENVFNKCAEKKQIEIDWKPLERPDLIVVGGGSILGKDDVSLKQYRQFAEKYKIPMVIFGAGFRQEKAFNEDDKKNLNDLLDYCSLVGLRGKFTKDNIKKGEVIGDPIFSFEPSGKILLPKNLWTLGIVARKISKYEESYLPNEEVWKKFEKIIDFLVVDKLATPYYYSFGENASDSDYYAYCEINSKTLKQTTNIIPFTTNELLPGDIVWGMDYVLSQRLHPMLLSWVAGHPSIGFEYQFGKARDCLETIGMEDWLIDIRDLSLENFQEKFYKLIENKSSVLVRSQNAIQLLRGKQAKFAEKCLEAIE